MKMNDKRQQDDDNLHHTENYFVTTALSVERYRDSICSRIPIPLAHSALYNVYLFRAETFYKKTGIVK